MARRRTSNPKRSLGPARRVKRQACINSYNWNAQKRRKQLIDKDGYLIDEDGNLILDENGNKIFVGP